MIGGANLLEAQILHPLRLKTGKITQSRGGVVSQLRGGGYLLSLTCAQKRSLGSPCTSQLVWYPVQSRRGWIVWSVSLGRRVASDSLRPGSTCLGSLEWIGIRDHRRPDSERCNNCYERLTLYTHTRTNTWSLQHSKWYLNLFHKRSNQKNAHQCVGLLVSIALRRCWINVVFDCKFVVDK